jgi:hypothetical protein
MFWLTSWLPRTSSDAHPWDDGKLHDRHSPNGLLLTPPSPKNGLTRVQLLLNWIRVFILGLLVPLSTLLHTIPNP